MIFNTKVLPATVENAKLLIDGLIPKINKYKPRFEFDIYKIVFFKKYNYKTDKYDLLCGINFFETDNPELDLDNLIYTLWWNKNKGWKIVSEKDFLEVFN